MAEIEDAAESCVRDLVQDLDAIVWEVDVESRVFTLVSQRAESLLGYPLDRWLTQPNFWSDQIIHPEDRSKVLASYLQAGELGDHRVEYRAMAADGRVVWLRHTSRVVVDDTGRVRRRGIMIDISDQKRAELALRESESRFRMLVENVTDIVAMIGSDYRFRYVSPAVERVLGYRGEEVMGRSPLEFVHPGDAAYLSERMASRLRGGGDPARMTEARFRHIDGSWRILQVRGGWHGAEPGERVIVLTARDVTERHRSERELHRQRAYFARLFDGAPEAIVLLDENDRVQRINEEFSRLFGYTRGEALGRPIEELVVPPDRRWEAQALSRRAARGERVGIETVRRRRDGSLVPVTILAVPVEFEDGTIHIYGIYRDATAQKLAERALAESEAQLRHAQKMEAVGRLAGGVAHDFNNVLTAIQGYAQLLLEGLSGDDPRRADAEEVWRSASRATGLTRQLLAFSRKQIMKPIPVDLGEIISGLEKLFRQLIGEDIVLRTELPTGLGPVIADPGQVEQVLMNLILNSRDAMPEGGYLTIRTRNVELTGEEPHLSCPVEPGEYVLLEVRDTGTGIMPEIEDRIFEPFFTTKEPGRGTGLGLSTVFGIVKQSCGHISVESSVGVGTTVRIYLPRAPEDAITCAIEGLVEPGEVEEAAMPFHGNGAYPSRRAGDGKATVLVVEDEDSVRALVCKVLRRYGCDVLDAGNGSRALELLERHEGAIDLVITDVAMPEMNGPELACQARRVRPELKFLFMSGYAENELVRRGVADGRMILLEKPFSPSTLIARVREVLGSAVPAG